jgi:Protein of unknown function (DUF4019)
MMAHSVLRRRVTQGALAWVALVMAGVASAQDPRAGMAQIAARDWLAKADKLDAPASYTAAGGKFREPITLAQWSAAIAQVRAPLGDVSQRAVIETAFDKVKSEGGADIEIVMLRYRTAFAHRPEATEVLTLEHEADSVWRVIGYEIR